MYARELGESISQSLGQKGKGPHRQPKLIIWTSQISLIQIWFHLE